ncbi:hypothetical protein LJC07_06685 [Christensenellaceae bacterium OttesenSCG-928-L17]|nr:hypothetical protein [Christensenellaceae bacterium OttesenSCG-928-L17]
MANEMIAGAEALVERILQEARDDAAASLKEAEEACERIRLDAVREAERTAAEATKRREDAVYAILDRSRTNAELSARKQALAKRRKVLDRAFDEAYSRLCELDEEQRARVCLGMLRREAEGGETVVPAARDRKLIEQLLPKIDVKLVLSKEDAALENGFLLVGDGFEKDCSFLAVLRDIRTAEDANVSAILFD